MPIDKYTKFVLTVIACALLAPVVQNVIDQSNARDDVYEKVQFCDSGGCMELFNVKFECAQKVVAVGTATGGRLTPVDPNARKGVFEKIQFCDSQGCMELFNIRPECAQKVDSVGTVAGGQSTPAER
ncbi:MAG: hypothetical protein K2Z80_02835 [Xanthobacteraceae bacterium]|nr:hypothetical protein [Xanthobacteraceae bacterium]